MKRCKSKGALMLSVWVLGPLLLGSATAMGSPGQAAAKDRPKVQVDFTPEQLLKWREARRTCGDVQGDACKRELLRIMRPDQRSKVLGGRSTDE